MNDRLKSLETLVLKRLRLHFVGGETDAHLGSGGPALFVPEAGREDEMFLEPGEKLP
jgi:hypothetical protein